MKNKKTICLVTNWYPTNENPVRGCFFKEQAFAVADYFDFIVVHYSEHIRKNIFKKDRVYKINEENNTIEYSIDVQIPIMLYFFNCLYNFKVKTLLKKKEDGVGEYILPKKASFSKNKIVSLFSTNIKDNIDAFYCVDAQIEAYNISCLAKHYNKPYVVGEHAPVPWPGTVINDINKHAIEDADLYLAISNDKIRQLLLQNIKLPKTIYIGNLIDENKLKCVPTDNNIKTFIIVGSHSFYKNYDLFIKVMNRLVEITSIDFKVMIVGYGANKGYAKDVDEFENRIKSSKFADKTILIPAVPHNEIGTVLNRADAFIMTSIQEGQPVSAMEAACCGLPIFSTRCGGVEDYVDDKVGRIYDVMDFESMANDLKLFLEEKIKFDSEYIRENVVKRFGRNMFIKTFKKEFELLMY